MLSEYWPGRSHTKFGTAPGRLLAEAGGQYALTAFAGTVDQIAGVWDSMLREWLPKSGMQLDARPFLEYYPKDASFDPKTGIFTCDVAIPVTPLQVALGV